MRRGFTILELLVATLLLGVMVTILTMIFNQSSASWRIGIAAVSDMDYVRDNMAELREEADNAFVYNGEFRRTVGLWDDSGDLRDRACDAPNSSAASEDNGRFRANLLNNAVSGRNGLELRDLQPLSVGNVSATPSFRAYTVNVMSGGPNNNLDDWQAIWSYPDDPSEW